MMSKYLHILYIVLIVAALSFIGYTQYEKIQIEKKHQAVMAQAEGKHQTTESLLKEVNEAFKDKESILKYMRSKGYDPELFTTTEVQLETKTVYKDKEVVKYVLVDNGDEFTFDDGRLYFNKKPNDINYNLNQHFIIKDLILRDDNLTKTYKLILEEIDKDGNILGTSREIKTNIEYLPTEVLTSDNYSFLESLHVGLTANIYTDLSYDITGHSVGSGVFVEYRRQLHRSNHDLWSIRLSAEQRLGMKSLTEFDEYRYYSLGFTYNLR